MTTKIRTYSELRRFDTLEDRYEYLKLGGTVGHATFAFDRHINQRFYSSTEWKRARDGVIVRDRGCDLGIDGYEIHVDLLIHHMNPMTAYDIVHGEDWILDPEYLITTTKPTHNAIHYGDRSLLRVPFTERVSGDTTLWEPIRR